jgi:hypothetical protein
MSDEVWALRRREAEMSGPRWRWSRWWWLPPWRDALLVGLTAYVVLLSVYVVVSRGTTRPPDVITWHDPFTGALVTCTATGPGTYACTQESR